MNVRREEQIKELFLFSPFAIIGAFVAYPVARVLIEGLLVGPGTSFEKVITSPLTQRIVTFTITQAILSTLLTILIGFPGAILLARLAFRGKSFVKSVLIVPFVLPPIVVVVGFLGMFGQYGILDSIAMILLGTSRPIIDLASGLVGIVLAHAFYNVPLVALMVSASLERLQPEIEEAAELLGATTFQKWRFVIIPHIRSAVVASAILTFLFCFMSFPIVLALGGGAYSTIEVQIWSAFRFFDYGQASSLALIQLAVTMVLAVSYLKLGTGTRGRSAKIKTYSLHDFDTKLKIAIWLYIIMLTILMAGPIAAIVFSAFYDPIAREYSLRGFSILLSAGRGGALVPLFNSVVYASLATIFAIVLGLPLAYAHQTENKFLPSIATTFTLLPLGISSITIAYGLMRAIAVPLGLSTNPWMLIVIAQTIIGLPFTTRALEISLRNVDPELLEQADILGASRLQRLFFVELPLLSPGILVGGVFAFAMAIGEMSATLFIALPKNYTLAVAIYQYLSVRKFLEAGATAMVLVLICVAAFIIIEKVSGEKAGGAL